MLSYDCFTIRLDFCDQLIRKCNQPINGALVSLKSRVAALQRQWKGCIPICPRLQRRRYASPSDKREKATQRIARTAHTFSSISLNSSNAVLSPFQALLSSPRTGPFCPLPRPPTPYNRSCATSAERRRASDRTSSKARLLRPHSFPEKMISCHIVDEVHIYKCVYTANQRKDKEGRVSVTLRVSKNGE